MSDRLAAVRAVKELRVEPGLGTTKLRTKCEQWGRAVAKRKSNVVTIAARQANLKRRIRRHLDALGFRRGRDGELKFDGADKAAIRLLHSSQRDDRIRANRDFIADRFPALIDCFASGSEVTPARISPALERVSSGTWQGDLFRLASLTWSVPVSNGFGRRVRYLVWDKHNDKLIGLIAIGDPVFNLAVRDQLVGWGVREREQRLVNLMDAYVLGAIPPYSALLGGKMVACLLRSRDIYDDFSRIYGSSTGIISKSKKNARLLAITTSSSMGRSSVYNRLKLDGQEYLKPIGYTGGWGHFHIPESLFADLRSYLRKIGHPYADLHRFGEGPNWRLRTMRAALAALEIREDILHHGIQRQVFICLTASNSLDLLRAGKGRANLTSLLSAREVAQLAVVRWMQPRALRRPDYRNWSTDDLANLLKTQRQLARSRISRVKQLA